MRDSLHTNGMRVLRLLVALTLFAGGASASPAPQFDPALRFRVLSTEHFLIYYHQGEESLARRLASIASTGATCSSRSGGVTPPH